VGRCRDPRPGRVAEDERLDHMRPGDGVGTVVRIAHKQLEQAEPLKRQDARGPARTK
jgi:hypothetical protein